MKDTKELILKAKIDENTLNEVIENHRFFILRCCNDFCKRYVDISDDEFSVAQYAFCKAVTSFNESKSNNFKAYASVVIKNALTDNLRKNAVPEIAVSPSSFEDTISEDGNVLDFAVAREITKNSIKNVDIFDSKLEIDAIEEVLNEYGFNFFDLAKVSPKAAKTKEKCAIAIRFLINNLELIKEMRVNHNLPIKIIELNTDVPRKILERHRKYIIAAVEIISGDYPCLAEYLRYIKRKE